MNKRIFYLLVAAMFTFACNKNDDKDVVKIKKLLTIPGISIEVGGTFPPLSYVDNAVLANTSVEWHTDNETVAGFTNKGYLIGLSKGVATITCTAYNGKVQDSFTLTILDADDCLVLQKFYTGTLSTKDGEVINTDATVEILFICVDGPNFDFGYYEYVMELNIIFETKNFSIFCDKLKIVPENNKYFFYSEATCYGYFVKYLTTVSGTITPENGSANCKINIEMETPVNLIFQGLIKS